MDYPPREERRRRWRLERQVLLVNTVIPMARFIVLMMVAMFVLQVIVPVRAILEAYARRVTLQGEWLEELPDLEARAQSLRQALATLSSDNISSRLTRIEESIRVGDVKTDQ